MILKQTISALVIFLCSFAVVGVMALPVAAQNTCGKDSSGEDIKTSIINCSQDNSGDINKNAIWGVLLIAINVLTAGIGIAAVGGIIYGSILYTTASDDAGQTKKAIETIRNVILGLVAYGLMYIGLNFLIPGGIFS